MNYVGLNCPVCGKKFTADDDIVVCPQCGAPYHRECYAKVGKCIFEDRHGTADAWTPPHRESAEGAETKRCPRCGAPNPQKALFCSHCGYPFSQEVDTNRTPYGVPHAASTPYGKESQDKNPRPGGYPPYKGPIPFQFDPMGGVNLKDTIKGEPAADVAKVVQSNTQYYLPTFMNLDRFRRNRFNFSSFLFPGLWTIYRKQYKVGAFISFLMEILLFFYIYFWQFYSYPIYVKLLGQIGISNVESALTNAQRMQMANLLYTLPKQQILLFMAPFFILLFRLIVRIVVGFLGNRMYLKHCLEKVHSVHKACPSSTEADVRFQEEGGVNMTLAAGLCFCFLFLYFIIPQLL